MNYKKHAEICGGWKQIGSAVVCSCGALLYHGTLPKDMHAYAEGMDAMVDAVRKKIQDGEIRP